MILVICRFMIDAFFREFGLMDCLPVRMISPAQLWTILVAVLLWIEMLLPRPLLRLGISLLCRPLVKG